MKKLSFLLVSILLTAATSCNEPYPELEEGMYAEFKTNKGTFVAELFYKATPMTVASFVSLAEGESTMVSDEFKEKEFYDGLSFHRVIEGFMIQGGDPEGTGSGGPGYKFPNEIVDTLSHDSKGILSMANSGPNTNGSQFFVTLAPTPWLDGLHTVFGKVVIAQDVVDKIGSVETGPNDKPVEPVIMEEVNIIRKGDAAEEFEAPEVLAQELEEYQSEIEEQEKRMTELRNTNKERFDALREEADSLESGLKIHFEKQGEGPEPNVGDTVMVNYRGYLPDGHLFDTNIAEVAEEAGILNEKRQQMGGYAPMAVLYGPDAPMIPGFKKGIQQMNIGDKAVFFIPAHLGYGKRGAPPVIPPNSDLIFEVELVGLKE